MGSIMTPEMKDIWAAGYQAGMRCGFYGEPAINPYPKNTVNHECWQSGAVQGYQDS